MKFLVAFSTHRFDEMKKIPLAGSVVEITSIDDLVAFQAKVGHALIISAPGWSPSWVDYHYLNDAQESAEEHRVEKLPEDWKDYRWIEIYNGYRE